MIQYRSRIPAPFAIVCCLLVTLLSMVSCQKEKAPEPSNLDKNYFVIYDNPSDPIDHALYEFYINTGIAIFYKDSIYKKKISREDENPARYTYIKLNLNYSPFGSSNSKSTPLSSRDNIPALLTLLENDVINKLPSFEMIPSMLLLDSIMNHQFTNIQIAHGWTSITGFNTIGVKLEEVEMMNDDERKMYAASILAGIAVKIINDKYKAQLTQDFFSISRTAAKTVISSNIYDGFPWMFLVAPNAVPQPQSIGLLFHPSYNLGGLAFPSLPLEADDSRAFLTAAFRYTTQEFADLHSGETLVQKKFGIIRQFAKEAGFKLPD